MLELELLFEAEVEFSEAYDWYEEKQPGLGDRFFREVNHYLELVQENPYHYQIRYEGELRVAPTDRFPFLIIFWIDEINQKIYVTSIFHTSREPLY